MTEADTAAIQAHSEIVWGSRVREVFVDVEHRLQPGYSNRYASSLSLDLDVLDFVRVRRPSRRRIGSLCIKVQHCALRIVEAGRIVSHGYDSPAALLRVCSRIPGDTLESIEVAPPAGDTVFRLASGREIYVLPVVSKSDVIWKMETEMGPALTLGPGASWSYRSADL